MSDMRERFVAQILDGQPVDWGQDYDREGHAIIKRFNGTVLGITQ